MAKIKSYLIVAEVSSIYRHDSSEWFDSWRFNQVVQTDRAPSTQSYIEQLEKLLFEKEELDENYHNLTIVNIVKLK